MHLVATVAKESPCIGTRDRGQRDRNRVEQRIVGAGLGTAPGVLGCPDTSGCGSLALWYGKNGPLRFDYVRTFSGARLYVSAAYLVLSRKLQAPRENSIRSTSKN